MTLVPVDKDAFINAHLAGYLLITFTRGADGQVNGLTMFQGNCIVTRKKRLDAMVVRLTTEQLLNFDI